MSDDEFTFCGIRVRANPCVPPDEMWIVSRVVDPTTGLLVDKAAKVRIAKENAGATE